MFFYSLLLTVLIEVPIVSCMVVKSRDERKRKTTLRYIILISILASLFTLPLFWFLLPHIFASYAWYVILGEIGVIVIESIFYFYFLNLPLKKAFFVSFTTNVISMTIGLLLPL